MNAINAETAQDAPKLTHTSGLDERLVAEISSLRAEIAELKGPLSKAAGLAQNGRSFRPDSGYGAI